MHINLTQQPIRVIFLTDLHAQSVKKPPTRADKSPQHQKQPSSLLLIHTSKKGKNQNQELWPCDLQIQLDQNQYQLSDSQSDQVNYLISF